MFTQKITPNPNIPCTPGWCLQYVREAFGLPARYGSATEAWQKSPSKHEDWNFPGRWVPVWFAIDTEPNGHVALLAPDASVYSSSDLTSTPHHHPNIADLIAYYARWGNMRLTFLGWSEDVAGYPVITPAAQPKPQPQKDALDMATPDQVIDGLLNKELDRAGGRTGTTSLGATIRYLDANLDKIVKAEAAQNAQITNLIGAIASLAKGQPFDQAKLLAGVQASAAAGVKDAIASIDTTVNLK